MAESETMDQDSSNEEEIETSRKDKIKDLVRQIKTRSSNRTMTRKRKASEPVSEEKEIRQCSGGRGKHSVYKLYLGWQHFSNEKYRVVTVKKGGGTRLIEYKADEDQTVEGIIQKGTQYFFPKRQSQLGDLEDMDLSLASFSGECLERFTDLEGNLCTLQKYLKSHGLFSSQYHLYLRTKKKSEATKSDLPLEGTESDHIVKVTKSSTLESSSSSEQAFGGTVLKEGDDQRLLLVNNEVPGDIKLSFRRTLVSNYSNNESSISCASMKTCYSLAGHHEIPYEDYNCLVDDGFLVTRVSKDDRLYLSQLADGSYQLQDYTSTRVSELMIYGPNEIYGMNDGDLILGLLAQVHNQNILYRWYKNEEFLCEGLNVSFIKVETPGVYSAGIYSDGQMCVFEGKCVVKDSFLKKNAERLSTPSELQAQLLSTSNLAEHLSAPTKPTKHSSTSSRYGDLHVPSEPWQQLPVKPEPTHQLSESSEPTHQLSVSSEPTQQLSVSSEPTQQLSVSSEPTQQLSVSSEPTQQLSVSSEPAQQGPAPSEPTQQMPVQPEYIHQLPVSSEHMHQLLVPFETPQQLQVASEAVLVKHNKLLPHFSETQPQLQVLYEPTHLPILTESTKKFPVSSEPIKPLPSSSGPTDVVDEIGCTCLTKVPITDIAFGEQIGMGAFGTVRKAEWLGTEVAVKEIAVKRMKFAKSLLKQELRIHSKVRHPNIIQLLAYTVDKNKLFMICELNDGRNLDDCIFGGEHEQEIPLGQKVYITKNVIQAIAYLHNQSPPIIHRDIKPENILVSSDFQRVRLCDLGISKIKTMNTLATTLDGTSMQPGTPSYQAPEVLLGRKSGSTASDIWSLGCTITELFTEVPAWNIPEDVEPVMYIVSCMKEGKQPDSLRLLSSKSFDNQSMVEILNRALNFEVNKRPRALEMLQIFKA